MSPQELDRSTRASDAESDALPTSNPKTKQSRFNVTIVAIGLIITLLVILTYVAFDSAPAEWVQACLAGLIIGFTLGTVFGIWIGRRLGNAPNLLKASFATGIVVLSACVGFFAIPFLTTNSIWPKDQAALGWSIGTAGTLLSATILCLVNFFWHSRDQQRIQTLRAALNKNRARIAEAEAKVADAQRRIEEANAQAEQHRRRAEEAERQADEQRKKAKQVQQEADQARTTADGAQRTAQQAQHIAEQEKRWRSNRSLLLGRWQCAEYSAQSKDANGGAGREMLKEHEKDKDILIFGADDTFTFIHPGKEIGLMAKMKISLGGDEPHERDVPMKKGGRWSLNEAGDLVAVTYANGHRETLRIQSLTKAKLTIDKSSDDWELLSFLVRIG